jgi:hypothetical protein
MHTTSKQQFNLLKHVSFTLQVDGVIDSSDAVAQCSGIKDEDCITVKHEPIEERNEVRHIE